MGKLLLVNDDGYKAAGLRALQVELEKSYDVTAIAPLHEQSWMGKSVTGRRELTLEPAEYHGFKGFTVDGTPADCTQIGMYELLREKPELVVSGLNHGSNIGHSHILSSGTVGAALEAGLQGIPAFAASVWRAKTGNPGVDLEAPDSIELFKVHAEITVRIIDKVMAAGFPADTQVIVINIPHDVAADAPWVITRPHGEPYGALFKAEGNKLKNAGTGELDVIDDQTTDVAALIEGRVSIVPLTVELTSQARQRRLADILRAPILGDV